MHPAAIAAVAPDRPAIVMAGSGRVITCRQLGDRPNQLAGLRDRYRAAAAVSGGTA